MYCRNHRESMLQNQAKYGQKSLILAIFRQNGKLFLNELRIIQHPFKLADNLLTIIALRGLSGE